MMKKSVWKLIIVSLVLLNICTVSVYASGENISVSSTPSGADIWIDGRIKGKTPFTITQVPAGSHSIRLTLNEYDDWTTNVVVFEGNTTPISATLLKTAISFSSTPPGADIWIDGRIKGKTPSTITRVSSGSHTIKLTLNEYDDWTTNVVVVEGNTEPISATLLKTAISFSSTPLGADIWIDGRIKGKTPSTITRVSSGSHAIKLTLNEYDDWTTNINVIEGNMTPVSATLTRKEPVSAYLATATNTPTSTTTPLPISTPRFTPTQDLKLSLTNTPTYTTPLPISTPEFTPTQTKSPFPTYLFETTQKRETSWQDDIPSYVIVGVLIGVITEIVLIIVRKR